jgi:hypothetical protein
MQLPNLAKTPIDTSPSNKVIASNKVITMSSTSVSALERMMTHDEGRIIFLKLEDVHAGNGGGYIKDWSDEKVARDLNVPRSWVTKIRDDCFGSDTNEQTSFLADAVKLLTQIKTEHTAMVEKSDTLLAQAMQLEGSLLKLTKHG